MTVSGGTWTNSSTLTVGNSGNGTLNISGGSVSDTVGTIASASTSTSTVTVSGGTWTNSSTLTVGNSGNGTLNISGGSVSDTYGTIALLSASIGTATVSGGTWVNSTNLTVGNNGNGTLTISNGGTVSVNNGAGVVNLTSAPGSIGIINIGAAIGTSAVAPGTMNANAIIFGNGQGTLVFNHTSSAYTFTPTITGYGWIDIAAGTTIFTGFNTTFSGFTSITNGTLEADSVLGGTLSIAAGGKLQGNGTVSSVTLVSGATIAPGLTQGGSTGTLTISGNYTRKNSGSTMIDSLTPSAGSKLIVTGAATLGGTLSYTPSVGSYTTGATYTIVSAGSVSGTFGTVTNTLPGIAMFDISYTGDNVILTVVSAATTDNWTSSGSSSWFTAGNWSTGVPLSSTNAAIDPAGPRRLSTARARSPTPCRSAPTRPAGLWRYRAAAPLPTPAPRSPAGRDRMAMLPYQVPVQAGRIPKP